MWIYHRGRRRHVESLSRANINHIFHYGEIISPHMGITQCFHIWSGENYLQSYHGRVIDYNGGSFDILWGSRI